MGQPFMGVPGPLESNASKRDLTFDLIFEFLLLAEARSSLGV